MTATFTPRPDLIQVTYRVLSDKLIDPEKRAKEIALGQTTDAWNPTDPAGKKRAARFQGAVLGIDERTHEIGKPYEYHLTIGFPASNTEGDIPSLLTMVFGKISLDGRIRLQSIEFPEDYLKGRGPRFGIPGIRSKAQESQKPLLMATLKPCLGLSPTELAKLFTDLSRGGAHIVKDDEILPDLPTAPTEKRLECCLKAAGKTATENQRRTLYAVNLTGAPSKLVAKARRLARLGADLFVFNVFAYGYGLFEELREVGVPLMAHPALSAAFGLSPDYGIRYAVLLGTLTRLAGADLVLFPSNYGTRGFPESETTGITRALTRSFGSLMPTFPVPSDGVHPGLIPRILKEYGPDVVISAGSNTQHHPSGVQAGVRAFRQAINWSLRNRDFSSLPEREYPELAQALSKWGRK